MLAGAAALGAGLWPAGASAQRVPPVACGLNGKTATQWPYYVADRLGFFKRHGVEVDFIVVGSVASCAQQLTAGALDIGEISSTQIVEAVKGGAPLKFVIDEVGTPPYWLIAKGEIRSMNDLKGKTIIIGGVNDITHLCLDAMIKPFGLRPDDYTLTYAGASNVRYAALRSGSVDAALLLPPYSFIAEGQGYSNLGAVRKYFGAFPFTGVTANMQWADAHASSMVAFTMGFIEGLRWLNNPANKAEAVRILMSAIDTDATTGAKSYDALITQLHAFSATGMIDAKGMTRVVSSLIRLKQIEMPAPAATQFFDNRFVRQAAAGLDQRR